MRKYLSISLPVLCISIVMIAAGCGPTGGNNGSPGPGATGPTPTPPDKCSLMTDKEIVAMIYGKIVMAGMGGEVRQIDVISKSRAITLWGWVKDAAEKQKVIDIAKDSCAVSVDSTNFYDYANNPTRPPASGCVPPYQRCGDICVSNSTDCSISDMPTPSPITNSNSPHPQANANSTTLSNSNANANHK